MLWVHVWAIKNINKKIVGAIFGVFLINSPIESIFCGFFDISRFFLFFSCKNLEKRADDGGENQEKLLLCIASVNHDWRWLWTEDSDISMSAYVLFKWKCLNEFLFFILCIIVLCSWFLHINYFIYIFTVNSSYIVVKRCKQIF